MAPHPGIHYVRYYKYRDRDIDMFMEKWHKSKNDPYQDSRILEGLLSSLPSQLTGKPGYCTGTTHIDISSRSAVTTPTIYLMLSTTLHANPKFGTGSNRHVHVQRQSPPFRR